MARLEAVRNLNWVQLGAELVLIFVGITAALWFDNLNEDRQARVQEASLLAELITALEADASDIADNLGESAKTLASIDTVLARLASPTPYDSALDTHFGQAAGWVKFIVSSAAYENLKVAGLNLVEDDALRARVIRYYERRLRIVRMAEDDMITPLWRDQLIPLMLTRFEYREGSGVPHTRPVRPVDYDALRSDSQYQSTLRYTRSLLEYRAGRYHRMLALSDSIREGIAGELRGRGYE